jgi:hypothetical protein
VVADDGMLQPCREERMAKGRGRWESERARRMELGLGRRERIEEIECVWVFYYDYNNLWECYSAIQCFG